MDRNRTIKNVLTNLAHFNNGRIHTYEKAMQQVKDNELRILFMGMIDQGRRIRNELGIELQSAGLAMKDENEKDSIWKKVGSMFSAHGSDSILKQCCQAESCLQEAYDEALSHDIPSYLRELFTQQKESTKASWQEMSSFHQEH